MARADQLLAGMLTAMRREDELLAALLDGLQGEDSSDDEVEVEEMWVVEDLLKSVCALEARLCGVEAWMGGRGDRAYPGTVRGPGGNEGGSVVFLALPKHHCTHLSVLTFGQQYMVTRLVAPTQGRHQRRPQAQA